MKVIWTVDFGTADWRRRAGRIDNLPYAPTMEMVVSDGAWDGGRRIIALICSPSSSAVGAFDLAVHLQPERPQNLQEMAALIERYRTHGWEVSPPPTLTMAATESAL